MIAAAARAATRFAAASGCAIHAFDERVAATFEVISDVTFSGGEGFDRAGAHHAINTDVSQTAKLLVLGILGAPGAAIFRPSDATDEADGRWRD
jgi:hypothetical protein